MIFGFLPSRATAERIAARSTSSGTPVKSCSTMRATTNGISSVRRAFGFQLASARTFCSVTRLPSQLRRTDSRTRRMETGSLDTGPDAGLFQLRQRVKSPVPAFPGLKLLQRAKEIMRILHNLYKPSVIGISPIRGKE